LIPKRAGFVHAYEDVEKTNKNCSYSKQITGTEELSIQRATMCPHSFLFSLLPILETVARFLLINNVSFLDFKKQSIDWRK